MTDPTTEEKLFMAIIDKAVADETKRLRTAGEKLLEGFEKGFFVRNVKNDDDPRWAMKLLPYLRAMAVFADDDFDESLGDA